MSGLSTQCRHGRLFSGSNGPFISRADLSLAGLDERLLGVCVGETIAAAAFAAAAAALSPAPAATFGAAAGVCL